jgi:hypothetical protein
MLSFDTIRAETMISPDTIYADTICLMSRALFLCRGNETINRRYLKRSDEVAEFKNEPINRRYLKRSDEEDNIEMCQNVREQKPKWNMRDYTSCLAAKTSGTGKGKRNQAGAGAAAGKQPTS